MSGLEVAGIVLGSLPLVISVLENYSEGLSALQRWRKYQRELNPVLTFPPNKNPFGDPWREEETDRNIRIRLWLSFAVFEATIGEVRIAIDEMKRRIDGQRDGKVSELSRSVFTLRRSTYEDLLKTIRDNMSNLENLTDGNIELEPARRVRSQGKLLKILRDMSNSFYRALRSSFNCSFAKKIAFQIAVSYKTSSFWDHGARADSEQTWQEIIVKVTAAPKTPDTTSPQGPLPLAGDVKKRKRVAFGFSQPGTKSPPRAQATPEDIRTMIPTLTARMASSIGLSNLGTALDPCDKLKKPHHTSEADCFGIIIDRVSPSSKMYDVFKAPSTETHNADASTWSVVSLRDVIEHKDRHPPLTYRDRDRLRPAVVVSSSLPETLTSRHILLLKKHDLPLYGHPILISHLPDSATLPPPPPPSTNTIPMERNPTLLALGYLLIELALGTTLDALRAGLSLSAVSAASRPMADYIAAQTALDRVHMASSSYEAAVARCMDGDLHRRGTGAAPGVAVLMTRTCVRACTRASWRR
ncbi:hypothetical protein B0T24DRAFT_725033 [Lasiosphaeria ovina]|uniref:Uncharacterized protein n=1 Tax=Lasiosphaeria ovina TaxID=92902 RepID=A0AAE0JTP1_9PEZI|nr:hypothetical protein B0T24DRAFT_725033 [Lasiosphaeria ovina]